MFKKWKIEIIFGEIIKKARGDKIDDIANKKKIFILSMYWFKSPFLLKYQLRYNVKPNRIMNSNLNKFIK